jgi:hypothetical protein
MQSRLQIKLLRQFGYFYISETVFPQIFFKFLLAIQLAVYQKDARLASFLRG